MNSFNEKEWRENRKRNLALFYQEIDMIQQITKPNHKEPKRIDDSGRLIEVISSSMTRLGPISEKPVTKVKKNLPKVNEVCSSYFSYHLDQLDEEELEKIETKAISENQKLMEEHRKKEVMEKHRKKELSQRSFMMMNSLQGIQRLHNRYLVDFDKVLGKGRFSNVHSAFDEKTERQVAIKYNFNRISAINELEIMTFLQTQLHQDSPYGQYAQIIRLLDEFSYENFKYLVYEALDTDLYSVLKRCRGNGSSLGLIRIVAMQLFEVLAFLEESTVDVIHADLKPENILVVEKGHTNIKVADFGSSFRANNAQSPICVQSEAYRAPEVILQSFPYTHAIDIWSVGCIMAELFLGRQLFPINDGTDRIQKMAEYLGEPPKEYRSETFCSMKASFSIKSMLRVHAETAPSHENDTARNLALFTDLLCQTLEWNPLKRITAKDALRHDFITNKVRRIRKEETPTVSLQTMKRPLEATCSNERRNKQRSSMNAVFSPFARPTDLD